CSFRTVTEQRARNSRCRIFTLIAEGTRPRLTDLRSRLADDRRALRVYPPAVVVHAYRSSVMRVVRHQSIDNGCHPLLGVSVKQRKIVIELPIGPRPAQTFGGACHERGVAHPCVHGGGL